MNVRWPWYVVMLAAVSMLLVGAGLDNLWLLGGSLVLGCFAGVFVRDEE